MTTTKKKTTTKRSTTSKPKATTKIPDLPPNPFVYEVLELASKQRSAAKKVEVLKKFEHDSLKSIFIFNFDETVISLLPEGEVPYGDAEDQSVFSGTLSENIAAEGPGVVNPPQVKTWTDVVRLLSAVSGRTFITLSKVAMILSTTSERDDVYQSSSWSSSTGSRSPYPYQGRSTGNEI